MTDAECLKYKGFLGHQYAVTVADTDDGRRCYAEVNDIESARRIVAEPHTREPRIFRKTGKTWKRTA